jgi:hypothetical protein
LQNSPTTFDKNPHVDSLEDKIRPNLLAMFDSYHEVLSQKEKNPKEYHNPVDEGQLMKEQTGREIKTT